LPKSFSNPLRSYKEIGGPVADEIGEYLAASVRPYTVVRQVEAVVKAQRMLQRRGLSTHSVPPRLLLPILEGASIEDEEDLHTKWSALLANAASSDKVHPSYIEILKQLTPDDARLLDRLYEHTIAKGKWLNEFLEEEACYVLGFLERLDRF